MVRCSIGVVVAQQGRISPPPLAGRWLSLEASDAMIAQVKPVIVALLYAGGAGAAAWRHQMSRPGRLRCHRCVLRVHCAQQVRCAALVNGRAPPTHYREGSSRMNCASPQSTTLRLPSGCACRGGRASVLRTAEPEWQPAPDRTERSGAPAAALRRSHKSIQWPEPRAKSAGPNTWQ
eukprot:5104005-Alexandrium_andersonii.AAC.1